MNEPERTLRVYVRDIAENIERILRHVGKMEFDAFMNDEKTQDAVARCIEVIGEAVKKIFEKYR